MNAAGAAYSRRPSGFGTVAFAVAFIFSLVRPLAAAPDFVHAEGKRLVDGHGDTFVIKGINLGHWLVPEGYMFKFKQARSPSEIAGFFDALIGRGGGGALLDGISRRLYHRGGYPLHQGGRLQHRSRAAELAAFR